MMPRNLLYVRHGQSVRNLAGKKAYENGDTSLLEEIINRPSSVAQLTPEGMRQAVITGEWIRSQGLTFDRCYTSSFNRAKQTAALLDIPGAEWFIENRIRERSSGVMEDMRPEERRKYLEGIRNRAHLLDLFNFRPDRGESFADVAEGRWYSFFGTLDRECGDKNVIVVNHGDNMWATMYAHERWTPEDFSEKRGGVDAVGAIPNCTVLHYTRINPETQEELKNIGWMRKCCPWQDPTPSPWRQLKRLSYSSKDLLAQVEQSVERVSRVS
jgi:broad specificity phosphatase PhoE